MRLVAQRLAGPRAPTAADAVRRLAAVQGQDLPGALVSVALRTASGTRSEVESALADGEVVRSWPMRGTLHLVAAEDLPWMIGLLGPRVLSGAPARRAQLGITDADIEKARGLAVEALSGGRQLRRAELLAALLDGGVEITGQRGYHLLWYLSQTCTLCLGPMNGRRAAVRAAWTSGSARRGVWRATRRSASSPGGSSAGTVRRPSRISPAGPASGSPRHEPPWPARGRDWPPWRSTAWSTSSTRRPPTCWPTTGRRRSQVRLLPGFDEFVLGYADRTCAVPPEFADRIVPGGNGMFRPTVVSRGRVVGTWGWTGRGAKRSVTATPVHRLRGRRHGRRSRAGRCPAVTAQARRSTRNTGISRSVLVWYSAYGG